MVSDGIVTCETLNFLLKISAAFIKLFFNEVSKDSEKAHFIYFSTAYAYNYFFTPETLFLEVQRIVTYFVFLYSVKEPLNH